YSPDSLRGEECAPCGPPRPDPETPMATRLPSFIDGTDTGLGADHPLTALARFYRAFNQRDLDAMARNWNDDDTVSMSNPLGGIARGWPAIRAVYGRIFAGNARVQVAFHDFTLHEAGDLFYVVGRERGTLDKGSTHLYLAQPLVGLIGPSLGLSIAAVSLVTTLTLLGYALGLFVLVPLCDLLENRRLVLVTLGANTLSLLAAACPLP